MLDAEGGEWLMVNGYWRLKNANREMGQHFSIFNNHWSFQTRDRSSALAANYFGAASGFGGVAAGASGDAAGAGSGGSTRTFRLRK